MMDLWIKTLASVAAWQYEYEYASTITADPVRMGFLRAVEWEAARKGLIWRKTTELCQHYVGLFLTHVRLCTTVCLT